MKWMESPVLMSEMFKIIVIPGTVLPSLSSPILMGPNLTLSNGLTVQKVIALRDGSYSSGGDSSGYGMDDDVSGFKLFATDTNDNVTAYCFDLNGVLSSTENLSDAQVAALETQQIIDINNDGTVGVTVLDELVSRYSGCQRWHGQFLRR